MFGILVLIGMGRIKTKEQAQCRSRLYLDQYVNYDKSKDCLACNRLSNNY